MQDSHGSGGVFISLQYMRVDFSLSYQLLLTGQMTLKNGSLTSSSPPRKIPSYTEALSLVLLVTKGIKALANNVRKKKTLSHMMGNLVQIFFFFFWTKRRSIEIGHGGGSVTNNLSS